MAASSLHPILELVPPAGIAPQMTLPLAALTTALVVQRPWGAAPLADWPAATPPGVLVVHHFPGLQATDWAALAGWQPPTGEGTATPPLVLVLLPQHDADLQAHYLRLGAVDVLPCPPPRPVLCARLEQLLAQAAQRAAATTLTEQLRKDRALSEKIINLLVPISVELTTETNFDQLLEKILHDGMSLCGAEGGTVYVRTALDTLCFMLVRNEILHICMGGPGAPPIHFPPLPLYDPVQQQANRHYVACVAANAGETVNIADIYDSQDFDFSGARAFDQANSYRTRSMLTVPLKTRQGRVIGVLQLINAHDPSTPAVVPFDQACRRVIESLAQVAAAALESCRRLDQLRLQVEQMRLDVDVQQIDTEVKQIVDSPAFLAIKAQAQAMRAQRQARRQPALAV